MSLITLFDRGASFGRDRTAYVMNDRVWSFGEAQDQSNQTARALASSGLPQGTKCAVLSDNDPASWLCVLSVWRAGMAWVPLNPRAPIADQVQLISGFDVEVLFFKSMFGPVIEELRTACPGLKKLICIDGAPADALCLDEWLRGHMSSPMPLRSDPADLAAIMPTGGTTGTPKGVMLSHRNLVLSAMNGIVNTPYAPDEEIVNLAAAPMTHTAGFLTLPATARGGKVVVLTKPDPAALLDSIENHAVTEFFLPPTVIYRLLSLPDIRQRDFSSLRFLMYGAAPMSVEKLREALEVFGPVMHQGYGQTEAPGSIAFLRPGDHFRDGQVAEDARLQSCGQPSVFNATAILDDNGNAVAQGETGEICVRGDIVMMGYYKNPEQTAETIVDGWLHTGDLGHIDAEGFLHITDRKKDMIISGGFNIYPSEIEQVIWSHSAVLDCAVIGVPHPDWGEQVTAVVELKPGHHLTSDEVIALCKERLGPIRAPKVVEFSQALPRSPVGKVLKKDLRLQYSNKKPEVPQAL